jgi:soluble lytic murein transglycosylase-like protein
VRRLPLIFLTLLFPALAWAGAQKYEPLSDSVRAALSKTIADQAPPGSSFLDPMERVDWLTEMSQRLRKRIPNHDHRYEFLRAVHYEATRAGLDPQLVLGLIQVESGFKKYAVSSAGARGFMQVMPFWIKLIGSKDNNLFHLRTNLRYGCTILRHYLDIEQGDLFRALGRYNGSLGRPEYPNLVLKAWQGQWLYTGHKTEPLSTRRGDTDSASIFLNLPCTLSSRSGIDGQYLVLDYAG